MMGSCRQKIGAKRTIWRQLPALKRAFLTGYESYTFKELKPCSSSTTTTEPKKKEVQKKRIEPLFC